MLPIVVEKTSLWDERAQEFIDVPETKLTLEHSLVSMSKWEANWHIPFLSKEKKTYEQTIDYIKCMTITQNVNPNVYYALSQENINSINEYIDDPRTATWFNEPKTSGTNGEQTTSELIYYWMITLNIPIVCEKWHLNRLLTLIKICNIKNSPPKKMSKQEILRENARLNAMRRKKLGTKG